MSVAGFKKQLNKVNQFVSEKIAGAKGTELDDEFIEMERKIDVMGKLVEELVAKTLELLQPNPASRMKMSSVNAIHKMRGQAKSNLYPQPEGNLGENMIKNGRDMGEESTFGLSLVDAGEAFKHLAEVKYSLEENVKQNFLDPMNHLQTKDLKEVSHHRKKLSGRRLDFDCKKRKKEKGSTITDEELRVAEEKFEESKELTETAMYNLLENDVEQIAQLQSFIEAQTEFHRQALDIMQDLCETLESRRNEAAHKPKSEHVPKRVATSFRRSPSPFDGDSFGDSSSASYNLNSAPAYASSIKKKEPCCKALYDFEPENPGELEFKEGDIIKLISQIDDNWYEGSLNGTAGYFPINYVEVVEGLPR